MSVTTSADVSSTQSRPVIPTSKRPDATYRGISWGRSTVTSITRGSSIDAAVVDVRVALDREVRVFEELERGPLERALGEDESQHVGSVSSRPEALGSPSLASRRSNSIISSAVFAASSPLCPSLPPIRSSACWQRVGGQHAEHDRDAGGQRGLLQAPGRLPGDVVEVRRVAPDHRAEAHDAVAPARAARGAWRRAAARTRPGPTRRVTSSSATPRVAQRPPRAVEQLPGDVLVEPADDDRDAHPVAVDVLGRGRVLTHVPKPPALGHVRQRQPRQHVRQPRVLDRLGTRNPSPSIVRCEPTLSTSVKHTSSSSPQVRAGDLARPRPGFGREPLAPPRRRDRVEQLDAPRPAGVGLVQPDPADRLVGGAVAQDPGAEAAPVPVVAVMPVEQLATRAASRGPPSVAFTAGSREHRREERLVRGVDPARDEPRRS